MRYDVAAANLAGLSDKTAEQHVRDWLRIQGYPLEYEAARVLRAAGFRTIQGWSYRDVDELGFTKAREIDVFATWEGKSDKDSYHVRFSVAVEAKHMTAPWVVLTTSHPADWTPIATWWMVDLLEKAGVSPQIAFPLPPDVGFAVKTATPKGADVAREALMQATNAAAGAIARGERGGPPPEWALPVVVVRGALFTLGYTRRGAETLQEVPWCRMVWHGADAFDKPTLVDVVTRSHWRQYVRDLHATTSKIIKRIDDHRDRELAARAKEKERLAGGT